MGFPYNRGGNALTRNLVAPSKTFFARDELHVVYVTGQLGPIEVPQPPLPINIGYTNDY